MGNQPGGTSARLSLRRGSVKRDANPTASTPRAASPTPDAASRRPSFQPTADPSDRAALYDHLVVFYARNDNERLMAGEVDLEGIVDWALSIPQGIEALNANLAKKYGEDLNAFLLRVDDVEQAEEDEEPEAEEGEEETDVVPEPSEAFPGDAEPSPVGEEAEAVLSRPLIPAGKRRPTRTVNLTLDANGEVVQPSAPSLEQDLEAFALKHAPGGMSAGELAELLMIGRNHGMIALNSELILKYGVDLSGNTEAPATEETHRDYRLLGVGQDSKVIEEMRDHKLRQEAWDQLDASSEKACTRFRLDTTNPVFGMCKCGRDRALHAAGLKRSSVVSTTLERKLEAKRTEIEQAETPREASTRTPQPSISEPVAPNPSKPPKPPGPKKVVAEPVSARLSEQPRLKPPPPSTPKSSVSSVSLGSAASAQPPAAGKAEEACTVEDFVLDMNASEFGTCAKCRWKKAEHHKRKVVSAKPPPPSRPKSVRADGPKEPCGSYKLDVNATTFGVCACGFAKQAHGKQMSEAFGARERLNGTLERKWKQVRISTGAKRG